MPGSGRGGGQTDLDNRAAPRRALEADPPTVLTDDAVVDREAEPLARPEQVPAEERFERPFDRRRVQPPSRVAHRQLHPRAGRETWNR